jgi:hypothetical protein
MNQENHKLRHDDDGMVFFERNAIKDTIPFQPEWVETEGPCAGLPTKVGSWIEQNLQVGETVVGVRWLHHRPYFFMLTRFEKTFRAQFKMPDKRLMSVTPGVIEISRYEPSNELLVRYLEYKIEGGTTWKAWFVTKRQYDYNYHDCPQFLEVTLSMIDNLLYQLTKVPNCRAEKELFNRLPALPAHLAVLFERRTGRSPSTVTPIEFEKIFHYLAGIYYRKEAPNFVMSTGDSENENPTNENVTDSFGQHAYERFWHVFMLFLNGKEHLVKTIKFEQ